MRRKYNAINHGQGFPDWESPKFVKQAGIKAIKENWNQYAPNTGNANLINELIKVYNKKYNYKYTLKADNIQITNGCAGAIDSCLQAFVDTDDEVITFEPYFDFYRIQTGHSMGKLVTFPLDLKMDKNGEKIWSLDPHKLKSVLNKRSKILLLNTPHNPTGFVMTLEQMKQIALILKDYPRIIVIMDEVYDHILYDNMKHHYFAALSDDLFNRTIVCSSAAKTFSVTGWKIGWAGMFLIF